MLAGGLGLIAWSAWELSIRLDDFSAWISGLRHLSEVRQQSFWENLRIMMEDPKMEAMVARMLFLALTVLLGLLCLLLHRRRGAAVPLLVPTLAVLGWGLYRGFLAGTVSGLVAMGLLLSLFGGEILNRASPRAVPPPTQEPPRGPQPPYFRR